MAKPLGKKVDTEKIVQQYINRFKGEPDALRLIVNMLADKVTDLDILREHIIRHEFQSFIARPKANKEGIIKQLSENYGLNQRRIQTIIEG